MRIPRWGIGLLGVGCCGFVGCSQTGWLRPNGPADMKTVASIDGKPVSTAAGEPGTGTARREDVDDLGPPPAAGSRISGRVFDEQGRAVPNARVRLGVGGQAGGRVNFATTDRSGAFTLRGLRPGRDYTVIAEYQSEDGMMSGRVQAHAPETGIRVALAARDPETEPRGSKILPARVRSGLFPEPETDGFPAAARPQVRESDDPPARQEDPAPEETTSYAPRKKRAGTTKLASGSPSTTVRAGWTVRQQPTEAPARRPRAEAASESDDPREAPPGPETGGVDEDGENPLPPALEPVGSGGSRSSGREGSRSTTSASANARDDFAVAPSPRKARAPVAARYTDEGDSSADREADSYGSAPRPFPDDAFPSSADIGAAYPARNRGRSTVDASAPPPRRTSTARRSQRTTTPTATRSREAVGPNAEDAQDADGPAEDNPPRSRSTRRPTWRELSISPDDVPVDEALRRSSAEEEPDDREAVVRAGGPSSRDIADRTADIEPAEPARHPSPEPARIGNDDEPRTRRMIASSSLPAAARRPRASTGSKAAEAACRLDTGTRRVVELRLPGLDGRMVSLADVDADLILLDFWGSWCQECRASIEHHRELQEQLGGKRLQVIGIACEKGATLEARRAAAAAAARKLGVKYPVLVTGMDGNCPVQRALQVHFYPSMVLLDREGNILQFEQGATEATLGRIDRAIAKAVREADHRDAE